jgi:hypothetical protein
LLLILLMLPMFAQAAGTSITTNRVPNWYEVELIVFRYTDPSAGSLESWPFNPGMPDWDSAVPLNPNGSGLPYMQLSPSSFRLDGAWRKLIHSSDYQPLLHVAWTQPAIDRASALFVRIGTPPTTATSANTAPAPVTTISTDSDTQVYGAARLSTTGPYLHFDLDLVYRGAIAKASIPDNSQQTVSGDTAPLFQWYRMTQDRRIDASKLNYFDQPLFGVLLLVTPDKAH